MFACLSANVTINEKPDDPTDCSIEVQVPEDFHVCFDEEFKLNGLIIGDYDDYTWFENSDETNYDLDEEVSIDETTTFTLVARYLSEENIIVNGDFEDGDSDFTTDYEIGTTSCYGAGFLDCEGTYGVLDNPNLGHTAFSPCSDQSGGGNMMVVNGAASLQEIWCQEVCVEEGAEYDFSAWATSVNPSSPAQLQFSIEGNLIGSLFSLSGDLCDWEQFEAQWTSETTDVIEICVTNQNTASGGNDFAIDNIRFFKYCEDEASFTVTHSEFEAELEGVEDLNCINETTDGLIIVEPTELYDFELYFEEDRIDEETESEFYFEIGETGEYTVLVTDAYGCSMEIEFELEADYDEPDIEITSTDTIDCQQNFTELQAESNTRSVIINWYDSEYNFLDSKDEISVNLPGLYYVEAVDPDNGCNSIDSFIVLQDTSFTAVTINANGQLSCNNPQVELTIDDAFDAIQWSFNGQIIYSDTTAVSATEEGLYVVQTLMDNGCSSTDSFYISETEPVFNYDLLFDTLINCNTPVSQLEFSSSNSDLEIEWDSPSVQSINNGFFTVESQGIYNYTLTDTLGCTLRDSIVIDEDFELPEISLQVDTLGCSDSIAYATFVGQTNDLEISWIVMGDTIVSDSIPFNEPSLFDYVVYGQNGCSVRGSSEMTTSEEFPIFNIIGDTLTCDDEFVSLYPESTQTNLSYIWVVDSSSTILSDTLIVNQTGTFALEAINSENCKSIQYFEVVTDTIHPIIELPDDITLNCIDDQFSGQLSQSLYDFELSSNGNWFDQTNLSFNIVNEGQYGLTATAANGCSSSDSFIVYTDLALPVFNVPTEIHLDCNMPDFEIQPVYQSGDYSVEWTMNGSTSTDQTFLVDDAGLISLTVTGPNGCQTDSLINVSSDFANPSLELSADTIDCINTSANIYVSTNAALADIFLNNDLINLNALNAVQVTEPGDYTIQLIAQNGCSSTASVTVDNDISTIEFEVLTDSINCTKEFASITVVSQDAFNAFDVLNENGGYIGSNIDQIDSPGNYILEIENHNGCKSSVDFQIIANLEKPEITYLDTEQLKCQSSILISELIVTNATSPYSITIDSVEYEYPINSVQLDRSGDYELIITDANGCKSDTLLIVEEVDSLELETITDILIEYNSPYSFNITINKDWDEIESIDWYPKEGLSCYDCPNPDFNGNSSTEYNVSVTDIYGCEELIEIRVIVEDNIRYYIPNVISPLDYDNNRFTIFSRGDDIVQINSLKIYDRWGNEMFSKTNMAPSQPDLGWDGYKGSEMVEEGVYVYLAEILLRNGKKEILSGDITLLK